MTRNQKIALIIVVLVLLAGGSAVVAVKVIKGKSGPVVGPASVENGEGLVTNYTPQQFLGLVNAEQKKAGKPELTLDMLAMSRAIQSEHGHDSLPVRTWVAWSIRNAAGGPQNVFKKLTTSKNPLTSGKFAHQITDARYAATNASANRENTDLAYAVMSASKSADPSHGATNFFAPKLQDSIYAKALAGDPKYKNIKKNAATVRTTWASGGLVSLGSPDPSADVEFFGKVA